MSSHGFNAVSEYGPAASEFAADAHHCIMVRAIYSGPPHTRMWHEVRAPTRGLPSDFIIPDYTKCAVVLRSRK